MRGDSESASKNTSKPVFKYPKYSNIRIFENSLASDLVFVNLASVYFKVMAIIVKGRKGARCYNVICIRKDPRLFE